jgi:hypothetical protein
MNNLILRTTNSPYGDINKGSVLAQSELDGNFVSLKGEVIYTSTTNNDLVTFTKYNGESFTFSIGTDCVFITYSEFYDLIQEEKLVPHEFYQITDFQTVLDVPDFNVDGGPKLEVSVGYGDVSPIIVYATSDSTIDSYAYQPEFPNDKITYDWSFTETENTGTPAFGRISERIDSNGNRTDYDHESVYFIRYESYDKGILLTGVIRDIDGVNGVLSGDGCSFNSEIIVNEPIILNTKYYLGFDLSVNVIAIIDDNTLLFDTTPDYQILINGVSFEAYLSVHTGIFDRYKEFYIGQKSDGNYTQVATFQSGCKNTYVGDFVKFWQDYGQTFLLSNNVFSYNCSSNILGDITFNNTFGDDFNNNKCGRYMVGNTFNTSVVSNIIIGGFVNNIVGTNFTNNIIWEGFEGNIIGSSFRLNEIKNKCYGNIFGDEFSENKIGSECIQNIIGPSFRENIIGRRFTNNIIEDSFTNNTIGNSCYNNTIGYKFYGNNIGDAFHDNIIAHDSYGNTIGDSFYENSIGYKFSNNTIGNSFYLNTIGDDFTSNITSRYFHENIIDNGFTKNQILNVFYGNKMKKDFQSNIVYSQVFSIDFSTSGYVYQPFTCEIIANSIGDNRLRYTDPLDTLKYVAITD